MMRLLCNATHLPICPSKATESKRVRLLTRHGAVQAVLLPLLINMRRTPDSAKQSLKSMMSLAAPRESNETEAFAASAPSAEDVRRTLFGCAPAEAVSFRLKLLQTGDLPDAAIASVRVPALVLCSVKDRLFPSLREGTQPAPPVNSHHCPAWIPPDPLGCSRSCRSNYVMHAGRGSCAGGLLAARNQFALHAAHQGCAA